MMGALRLLEGVLDALLLRLLLEHRRVLEGVLEVLCVVDAPLYSILHLAIDPVSTVLIPITIIPYFSTVRLRTEVRIAHFLATSITLPFVVRPVEVHPRRWDPFLLSTFQIYRN